MNKIEEIITKLREGKAHCVKSQKWDDAVNWRSVERDLIEVIQGKSLKMFFKQFKDSKNKNFDEIYKVIKPLDVAFLRRKKILKIEKLYK